MPEPFKNLFSPELIAGLGQHLQRVSKGVFKFNRAGFVASACNGLEPLELKQRSRHITASLQTYLPADFQQACALLLASLHPEEDAPISAMSMDKKGVRGWAIMPMADFIAQRGMQDFDVSMQALAHMTKRFSAEFAVRPFIIANLNRALPYLQSWAQDPNEHVRRLASEGSRPRLPWGMQIPELIENPRPTLSLLERLRDDPSEYVRKSVANHLNDIAKDHPSIVLDVAKKWLKKAPTPRQRLVRHACRTLIKQGDANILQLFGYGLPQLTSVEFSLSNPSITVGESQTLRVAMAATGSLPQAVIVDYIVHFRLANGQLGKKVFKWKSVNLTDTQAVLITKQHVFRPITTRTFYSGTHKIELQVNGCIVAEQWFELRVPN